MEFAARLAETSILTAVVLLWASWSKLDLGLRAPCLTMQRYGLRDPVGPARMHHEFRSLTGLTPARFVAAKERSKDRLVHSFEWPGDR